MLASGIHYTLFVLAAVVGPGVALQRRIAGAVDPALVVPLGTAVAAGAYWLSLVVNTPWVFPAAIAILDLGLVLPRPVFRRAAGPSLRGAAPPAVALIALLAVTQYPWNRSDASGAFLLDPLVPYDTAFHVGLSRELTLAYPPQVPGLAGFPLGYHLGTDLVRAAALRWAAVDPYDSIARFDVTLYGLALILVLRGLTLRAGGNQWAVALVPWSLLATDFSFLFAGNPHAHWWTDLLRGNLLLSLALANPVVPALGLALGALIAVSRHEDGEGRGFLVLGGLMALAVPFFKVFLGAQLVLGLLAAALLRPGHARAGPGLVAVPPALATLALVLGQGGRTVDVVLAPLDLLQVTRDSLGLDPAAGWGLAAWALLWIAASLGLRLVGIPQAVAALRRGPTPATALAAIALTAWPAALLLRVSAPEVLPGQKVVNDAAYLVEQAGPLLWLFTCLALGRLLVARRALAVPALAAAAALSLPATVQFAVKKAQSPPDPLPAPMVRAMRAVETVTRPGDVVLQRPGARYPPAPVVLIGRRVAYERFTPYLTQFARREDLERRHRNVYRFFHTSDATEALDIAAGLRADHVCLYGAERLRFDAGALLEPIHQEPGARCYRIRGPGG